MPDDIPVKSLSVIVPALDEEGNIRAVCEDIARLAKKHLSDYEILVLDDASRDRTAQVAEELCRTNNKIRLFRNTATQGLGYNYRAGILKARCTYAMLIPGDNQVVAESLEEIFAQIGKTELVVCYIENQEVRPFQRQLVSKVFTGTLNLLFGLNLRYYNGTSVIQTELAREFVPDTSGYAYMSVMLIRLLRLGTPYKEMGFRIRERRYGSTKAFRFKNVISVIKNIIILFWKVVICRQLNRDYAELFRRNREKRANLC